MNNKIILVLILCFTTSIVCAAGDKKHFPGIFLGATHFDSETEFTYALEYEYKFTSQWGVGAIYEKTDDAHHGDGTTLKIASLYYHPYPYLRVGLGAGKEKVGGDHPHSEDLYRVSLNYDYHIGKINLEPTIAVDFIDGEQAIVFGIALVRPF